MPRRLSSVLTVWYAMSFLIVLGSTFFITWAVVDRHFQSQIDDDLFEDLQEFREYFRVGGLDLVIQEIARENGPEDAETEFFRLYSPAGVIASSPNMPLLTSLHHNSGLKFLDGALDHQLDSTIIEAGSKTDDDIESVEFREIIGGISPDFTLHIGESVSWKSDVMKILRQAFLSILGIGIPLISLVGWLMARRAVTGIEQVSSIAERIHRGHMDERVHSQSSEVEVRRLGNAFNSMLDRIHDLVTEMREMTDNIAHDLKSPLARIRFMSEVALSRNQSPEEQDENALQTIEECDRLINMINTSLDVAEAEAGINSMQRENFNFSSIVEDACELFQPVAEGKSILLRYEIQNGCWFHGNLVHIQRMVSNLIDNALKYTDAGGSVSVNLEHDANKLAVKISDTGIGIPEQDHGAIFKRFYRCDRSRSKQGCGLGLSYARAIARQYGGEINFRSTVGLGSVFVLLLPLDKSLDINRGPLAEENDHQTQLHLSVAPDT